MMSSEESDVEERLVELDIAENKQCLNVINILLLGETGVGKSTFINSVANYLTYKYFDIAEKNNLIVLIPSVFGIQDKHKKDKKITVGTRTDVNEYLETGESATQDVKTYVFPIWKGKVKVRIIDTPGLGDTRGIEQDEKNCRHILKYVSKLDNLHAVCFLFKPTESRRTTFFEYCFSQLLCRLDKMATDKLFFLFTRSSNSEVPETFGVLEAIFAELKKYSPDINIPLELNTNVFCFDNKGFRCLAAQQQKVEFSDEEKNIYKKSWKSSAKNWWNLLKLIRRSNKIPYSPKNIGAITKGRYTIMCFSKVLSQISDDIRDNDGVIQKLMENYNIIKLELEELKSKEKVKATVVYKERKSKTSLVCSSSSCIDNYKVGKDNQIHYKTVCHKDCEECNAEVDVISHPELVNCFIINGITRKCGNCQCDFSAHLLIDYETKIKEDYVLDEKITKQIIEKESSLRSSLDVINDWQRKNYYLNNEREIIKDVCHKLACFIQQMAIIPFNYCYSEYVEQCIWKERSNQYADKNLLERYTQLLKENEELNRIFEDALLKNEAVSLLDSDLSIEEIKIRYEQLFNLKFYGKLIMELLNKDEDLIENDNSVPEYVHDLKFDYKKERQSKDKHKLKTDKDKKKKDKTGDSKNNTDCDSDVSSVKEKKERKNKKNNNELKENANNDDEDDSYDSDTSRKTNESSNKNRGNRKWKNKPRNKNKDGSNRNIHGNDNIQRPRTPPPPYSKISTPSGPSGTHLENFPSHPYSGFRKFNENQGNNHAKSNNPSHDNKYEITVSIKEKNNPPPPNIQNVPFHQNPPHRDSSSRGLTPIPPIINPSQQPRFSMINASVPYRHPPPRYTSHDPRYAPPGPRYPPPGPSYPPPGPRYPPPGPRYPPPGPRYPQGDHRFPLPNPHFPLADNRLPPPNQRFSSPDTNRYQNQKKNNEKRKNEASNNQKGKSKAENSEKGKEKNHKKTDKNTHKDEKDKSKKK